MFKSKRTMKICSAIVFVIAFALLMWFLLYGENYDIIKSVLTGQISQDNIQETLRTLGIRGYITIALLAMLQVIMMFLPAEPVQVIAGLGFGLWRGLLTCIVGVMLGNTLIYVLYKIYGEKLSHYFDKNLDIDVKSYSNSKILTLIVFVLYFLPAIPYGMICFIACTMEMKYPRYITVTVLSSIPSVIIGVGLGHIAINSNPILSIAVFLVLIGLLAIVMLKRKTIFAKINAYIKHTDELHARRYNVRRYPTKRIRLPYFISRLVLFRRVKTYYKINVDKIEKPSIILCNHGSFIDFFYAGAMVRNEEPHFIVARLYFYKMLFARVMLAVGCFPKSMFSLDIESAKNSVRVLREGGLLCMMPEARLSTAGEFEDIQPQTYAFLKKSGVDIYTIKLEGDYFAKPKWSDDIRGGAKVYATLDKLISKEELEGLSVEEIGTRVENKLYYNEYEWLEKHPEIHYKSRKMAVGLENILTRCPACNGKYTLTARKNKLTCTCGMQATLNSRYAFENGTPFKNILEWYKWQNEEIKREITENPNFQITSRVELHQSSKDGKTMLVKAGDGVCTLDRSGLLYKGEINGEIGEKFFPLSNIYRILFAGGEDFEIYEGKEIWYFRPENLKSSVDWYIISKILKEIED